MPKVLADIAGRAIQVHGSLGISKELPFGKWVMESFHMGLADGATEVHKVNLAQFLLRGTEPDDGLFPPYVVPIRQAEARSRFADVLAAVDDGEHA
jgi:acyl-CoA dehydrogenase